MITQSLERLKRPKIHVLHHTKSASTVAPHEILDILEETAAPTVIRSCDLVTIVARVHALVIVYEFMRVQLSTVAYIAVETTWFYQWNFLVNIG